VRMNAVAISLHFILENPGFSLIFYISLILV